MLPPSSFFFLRGSAKKGPLGYRELLLVPIPMFAEFQLVHHRRK